MTNDNGIVEVDGHRITETLDAFVVSTLRLQDGGLVVHEEQYTEPIDGGYQRWACPCGFETTDFLEAEQHMKAVVALHELPIVLPEVMH